MKVYLVVAGLLALLSCRQDEPTPTTVPACIQTIIQQNGRLNASQSYVSITRYKYQKRYVYFGFSECCDAYDTLFDTTCQILCSPSGGFIGKGDGKCANFFKEATEETQIWQRPQ